MWTIKHSHPNPLPIEEAKRRLADAARDYCRFYGVDMSWKGDRLVFKGALLDGYADFTAASVDVEVTLGAGARTAKDRQDVESGIEMALAQCLRA